VLDGALGERSFSHYATNDQNGGCSYLEVWSIKFLTWKKKEQCIQQDQGNVEYASLNIDPGLMLAF
jgi:hypothetical protein